MQERNNMLPLQDLCGASAITLYRGVSADEKSIGLYWTPESAAAAAYRDQTCNEGNGMIHTARLKAPGLMTLSQPYCNPETDNFLDVEEYLELDDHAPADEHRSRLREHYPKGCDVLYILDDFLPSPELDGEHTTVIPISVRAMAAFSILDISRIVRMGSAHLYKETAN